jgi:hypothetical protein
VCLRGECYKGMMAGGRVEERKGGKTVFWRELGQVDAQSSRRVVGLQMGEGSVEGEWWRHRHSGEAQRQQQRLAQPAVGGLRLSTNMEWSGEWGARKKKKRGGLC